MIRRRSFILLLPVVLLGQDRKVFRITPVRPVAELRSEALASRPPVEKGEFRKSDLVDLAALDPRIKLDIRYATSDNFLSTPVYTSARAFLQRPAADALLRAGELVGVFPEGFKGIGKPFTERYHLQRFGRGGFAATAIRADVPLVPCAIVGAEEIYPMIGNAKPIAEWLRLPYFPITPMFPWLGPIGVVPLPSRWIIEFCPPVPTNGYQPGDESDPAAVTDLSGRVRGTIQRKLDDLLAERGPAFG